MVLLTDMSFCSVGSWRDSSLATEVILEYCSVAHCFDEDYILNLELM